MSILIESHLAQIRKELERIAVALERAISGPTCHKCGKLVETGDVLCIEHERAMLEELIKARVGRVG